MKLIVILFGCINSIDLDDGTNLLQTGILQRHAQGGDFDETEWKHWPAYQIYEQNGQNADECYPTLSEAIAKCDEAGDCGGIASQSGFCGGQYRITHGGPHLAGPIGVTGAWVRIKCVTPGGPTENGIVGGLKWDPGYVGTYRYYGDNCSDYGQPKQTTTTTTNLSDQQAACISRESVKNWANYDCCGFGTRDTATRYCTAGIDDHVIGELCCKSQCEDGCIVDGKQNWGVTTTTSTTPVTTSTTNPGGPTNVGGKDCFAAIATWGPDFECNAKVSSFCADDSADGLDVSACCQDYCSSNQEKRTKNKDSEANSKEAEGERKSKRQESRSKRKDAESARKKQKKEAEWLEKRGAQETSNKKAEDERKTKRGYSESKRKNERSWKANMAQAKKAAQLREATRKARRAESAKKNGGGESTKKGQQKEKKQKKKAAWKAKKEKRQKGRGRKGRKGPQVRR